MVNYLHDNEVFLFHKYCDTVRNNSFPFVLAPLRRSLFIFGVKPTQKALGRDFARDWKWRREGRAEWRQREQLTTEGTRERSELR